jgi:hypothetical protein
MATRKTSLENQSMLAALKARETFYASLGNLHKDVLAPAINPHFQSDPRWPSLRQGWRVVSTESTTIVASDGLSDPFDDDSASVGFNLEVCAELDERFRSLDAVKRSWLFSLVYEVSQHVADHGEIADVVEEYGVASTAVQVSDAPPNSKVEDDYVGVIIGFPSERWPSSISLPNGIVRFLTLKPLLSSELEWLEGNRDIARARNALVKRLLKQPQSHLAKLDRPAVA